MYAMCLLWHLSFLPVILHNNLALGLVYHTLRTVYHKAGDLIKYFNGCSGIASPVKETNTISTLFYSTVPI